MDGQGRVYIILSKGGRLVYVFFLENFLTNVNQNARRGGG